MAGSCQTDGTCKTLRDQCVKTMGGNWIECTDTEADGRVDKCGTLMCNQDSSSSQCFQITKGKTAGLPCTSPEGGNFGVCNTVDKCKAPTETVPSPSLATLVSCSGIGTYGEIMATAPSPGGSTIWGGGGEGGAHDPFSVVGAVSDALSNCSSLEGQAKKDCISSKLKWGSGDDDDGISGSTSGGGGGSLSEQTTFILIIVGASIGGLLFLYFLWWYKECECPKCRNPCGQCCDDCSDRCDDCQSSCRNLCQRSPEAIAAAKAARHEKNKIKHSKAKHKAQEKEKKKLEKIKKKKEKHTMEIEMEEGKLATGWTEEKDEKGNVFYWNDEKGEASWVKPTVKSMGGAPKHRATDTLMPPDWSSGIADEYGEKFYVNPEGESQWDRPPGNEGLQVNPMNQ